MHFLVLPEEFLDGSGQLFISQNPSFILFNFSSDYKNSNNWKKGTIEIKKDTIQRKKERSKKQIIFKDTWCKYRSLISAYTSVSPTCKLHSDLLFVFLNARWLKILVFPITRPYYETGMYSNWEKCATTI